MHQWITEWNSNCKTTGQDAIAGDANAASLVRSYEGSIDGLHIPFLLYVSLTLTIHTSTFTETCIQASKVLNLTCRVYSPTKMYF